MKLAADLRAAVLQAAIEGKLTGQRESDTDPHQCIVRAGNSLEESIDGQRVKKKEVSLLEKGNTPFELPEKWEWVRLGAVCVVGRGGSPRPITAYITSEPNGINWIKIGDTEQSGKYIYSTAEKIKPEGAAKSRYVHSGDFLLTNSMSFGRPYILRTDGCIHDGWLVISQPVEVFNQDFLYWVLSSKYAYMQFAEKAGGGVVKNLNSDKVANSLFPVPPIEEQRRIVDRIDELMPLINEYEEIENRLVAMKEAFPGNLRDAVLQAAVLGQLTEQGDGEDSAYFVDEIMATKKQMLAENVINRDNSCKTQPIDESDIDLPEIPSNWTWARLGNLCSKIGAGSTPSGGSKVYVKSGIKFLREQNIHNSGLVTEGLVYITDEVNSSMKGSQVKAKDILMNITGASIGRNALVPDDFDAANVNQHVLIVRLIDDRLRHYIHQCLQSPFIFNQMMDKQMGDKPGLSATKVANFLIPIPPLAEQQRIVDRLNAILPLCDALAEEI